MAATVVFTGQTVNPGQTVQNATDFTPAAPIVNGVAFVVQSTFGAGNRTQESSLCSASYSIDGTIFSDPVVVSRISEFDPSSSTDTYYGTLQCPGATKIRFFYRNNDSLALTVNNLSVVAY